MLPTTYRKLHLKGTSKKDRPDDHTVHAVGITVDRLDDKGDEQLIMVDPWPTDDPDAKDRGPVAKTLESAHRDRGFHALIFYWVGWS